MINTLTSRLLRTILTSELKNRQNYYIRIQQNKKYDKFVKMAEQPGQNNIIGDDPNQVGSNLKTAKGARDIGPEQGWIRKRVFKIITDCFEAHGAQPLDTPVFELRELLTGKYGEDSKLIYNLEDQGGEALSLRYDLTVPFARHLAQNRIQTMTRYHIAKVYRRDNPSITKGRFREFYQCDIDFAGNYGLMRADSECLNILCEILNRVKLPFDFSIKINHRSILSGMFKVSGVPEDKFKPICSAVDKLDKLSWAEVKKEMCELKGLDEECADRIGQFVSKSGGLNLIEELLSGSELGADQEAKKGLEELKVLYKYADSMDISKYLKFDLSLARGLDYYTGLIFEAVVSSDKVEVGSIAAGGRYDNLVGSMLENNNYNVPCVGLSVGIERLFAIMESHKDQVSKPNDQVAIHCCIGSIGKGMSVEIDRIVREPRKRGIRIKDLLKDSVKPLDLYQACEKENAPFAIFFGPKDIEKQEVCLRTMSTRSDEKIPINDLADELEKRLNLSSRQAQGGEEKQEQ